MPKTVKTARVIEGGKTPSVEATVPLSPGTQAVDPGQASLLPGLVDARVHLVPNRSAYAAMDTGRPGLDGPGLHATREALQGARSSRQMAGRTLAG